MNALRCAPLAAALLVTACAAAAADEPAAAPPAAAVIRLDHLAIHAADRDASAAFYSEVFGLREIRSAVNGPRCASNA